MLSFKVIESSIQIKSESIDFYINEPYLSNESQWIDFLRKVKTHCKCFLSFGWLRFTYHGEDNVELFCECRGGMGSAGCLSVKIPYLEFCNLLEDFINSEQFMEIYIEDE